MDGYTKLAIAICNQAAKDYRASRKKLKKKPGNIDAQAMKDDCERFFKSDWYKFLMDSDSGGEYILSMLNEEEI